jgi:KUP system potassium uptake protein
MVRALSPDPSGFDVEWCRWPFYADDPRTDSPVTENSSSSAAAQGKAPPHGKSASSFGRQSALTLGALGIVYGDIGTSPLYAVRQSVLAMGGQTPDAYDVYGSISLIFWALTLVVTIKYVIFVLRADNKGEGGVLALAALAHRSQGLPRWLKTTIGLCAIVGLALFFGDGLLTPAISVLSAVEGLRVEQPAFAPLVLPLTLAILIGLFLIQNHGTGKIGRLFGPVMVLWFITLGCLGLRSILQTPEILWALSPQYALRSFMTEPWTTFVSLGAVILAVTGVEALYADMGHFGRDAIRYAWLGIALPALLLNYFGQGAALLRNPANIDHPFYILAPHALHYPVVILATLATVIASQAVISGVFSITQQAVQLGLLPRMEVRHTSEKEAGQIFIPRANSMLLVGVVAIVLFYKNSDSLASAYGMAIVGMMAITTFLAFIVALKQWHWNRFWLIIGFSLVAVVDLAFLSSVSLKLVEGAWLPLAIAAAVYVLMDTWREGRRALIERVYGHGLATDLFLERADKTPIRVAGAAIYLTPRLDEVPGALLHNLKHNRVLHERVVLLRVAVDDTPFVTAERRINVEKLGKGFYTIELHFGFFEESDVPRALSAARPFGLALDIDATTFFIHHETLVKAQDSALSGWRTRLFIWLSGAALDAPRYYRLPPGRVVELGTQIEI